MPRVSELITQSYLNGDAGLGQLPAPFENRFDEVNAQLADTDQDLRGRSVNVKFPPAPMVAAIGDGVANDSAAITACLLNFTAVHFPQGIYRMNSRFVTNGHVITGIHTGETFYAETTIIRFFGMPNGTESCVHNEGDQSTFDGVLFEHAAWDGSTPEVHGLTLDRGISAYNCGWNAFPGYGLFLYRRQLTPTDLSPYHSIFDHCSMDFNKKHGIVIANGANSLYIKECWVRWSGSPSYKAAPTVLGLYDGIYVDGKMSGILAGFSNEPQGVIIQGGDIAYNSRHGTNLEHCQDNTIVGGYYEGNLSGHDMAVNLAYGCAILNPMLAQGISVTTPDTDPDTSSRNLFTYPNVIIVRGRNRGWGKENVYNQLEERFVSRVTPNGTFISPAVADKDIVVDRRFGSSSGAYFTLMDKLRLRTKWLTVGSESFAGAAGTYFMAPAGTTEGNDVINIINTNQWTSFFVANGTAASSTATAARFPANSVTGRSVNAGGTVNASGADYAEYMRKADGCGTIAKGQICGVNASGELTDKWEDAVTFVVKSTNPSYVGGDTWSGEAGSPPVQPARHAELFDDVGVLTDPGETDEEYIERCAPYRSELLAWEAALESERLKYDRVAFAGQVPVNVYAAQPGDWIIPAQSGDGIKGIAVLEPTLAQYLTAVGKVIAVEDDGRARIIVKVS